eukprot:6375788-Prymnesium_polylepis.1
MCQEREVTEVSVQSSAPRPGSPIEQRNERLVMNVRLKRGVMMAHFAPSARRTWSPARPRSRT